MSGSCKLAFSRASTIERTVPTSLPNPSRARFHVCKSSSSSSQPDVQLRIEHRNVNNSSRQGGFGKDELRGSFGNDEPATSPAPTEIPSQKPVDKLHYRQLGHADRLLNGELHFSRSLDREEEYTELPIDDEPLEPITKISVPRQKYIPVSKVSLVKALADSFNDEKKASEFLMICSLLDFILHAEHKTTLEQMRLDYKITRSALKKEAQHTKGKPKGGRKAKKKKGLLGRLLEFLNKRRGESKVAKSVSASMKKQLTNTTLDQLYKDISDYGLEYPSLKENKLDQGTISSSSTGNGTLSSNPGTTTSMATVPAAETTIRNSIAAAARFQRTFLKLLKNAHFQGLSARDLQLTSALNSDYLLTLPIEVDWKHTSSKVAIIFRRGYAAERQEGLLFGAKLDYIQSLVLRKIFNWFAKPLFRGGSWINQQLKRSRESDGVRTWTEEFTEWLKEPLKPEIDDDFSGIIADSLTDAEKEDFLPIWIAAQQAVPRYEAFLSSVGARGLLLRKILVWMRILPPQSPKLSLNSGIGSTSFASSPRGNNLARISMRDIWLPASEMVCGNNIWRRLRATFLVFFSRSILQEPAYKELVLLYNLSDADDDEREDKIPNLQLKIYGKIPIPDLKVIFPNKKLSFRILDTVRLDIATIIGLLAFLINYRFDDFLSSPSAFVLDIIASSALIVYITRVALGYKQTYDRYQLLVNKTLYEKTLASGFGAAQFLVDASEQQQFKECVLAFALLMNKKNAKVETRESLAIKCENFLLNHFKEEVQMPIDEALGNLSRLGLIEENSSSGLGFSDDCYILHAQPYIQSMSVLRERWTELLSDGSLPTSFLRSLYQTPE
ncbi:hypothetical protein GOP47_0004418 [Adiantum capillus-veneris]|uniref:Uncharacterized protein n=1 Tax=Adiantum capillus-veneris TaxID=13818 RepID=A0A9D4ZQB7_ADICA|nr:hypothetical protein GOP47_0004418 [Adiantum capillus-veneris]